MEPVLHPAWPIGSGRFGSEGKAHGEAEEGSRIAALIVAVQLPERLGELQIEETKTQQRNADTGTDRGKRTAFVRLIRPASAPHETSVDEGIELGWSDGLPQARKAITAQFKSPSDALCATLGAGVIPPADARSAERNLLCGREDIVRPLPLNRSEEAEPFQRQRLGALGGHRDLQEIGIEAGR